MSADVKLYLETDDSPALKQRRRGDCLRLSVCEDAWIKAHGSDQAKCPRACPQYVNQLQIDKRGIL
jgi:hypothetical protein